MLPFSVELTPVTEALIVAGRDRRSTRLALGRTAKCLGKRDFVRDPRRLGYKYRTSSKHVIERFAALKIQLLTDGPLSWLAKDLATTDAVNLLQGEFAKGTDYGVRWRRWRTAAALAAGLLVVHVGAQALQLRQAKHQTAALDSEIAQVYSSAMPAEPMQDARRQMQARLERIRHSGPGPEYFLRTLQTLSGALETAPNTVINALSYREQALDLRVTAPSLAALSQLSQFVGKEGLTAEIQSSNPVASGVEAHVQVRSQGSKAPR